MNEFLMITYQIALPIILGYIIWLLKEQKKSRDANAEGTKCLLRVKLIEYHDKFVADGKIPSYALQNFIEMYDAYHRLGGNGMITQMLEEVKELPINNNKKAVEP